LKLFWLFAICATWLLRVQCTPDEVVFTSGGGEANNHALKGVFFAQDSRAGQIITTQVEHPAVLNPCRFLERLGAQATYLPVDRFGRVDPDDVRRAPSTHFPPFRIQPLRERGSVP